MKYFTWHNDNELLVLLVEIFKLVFIIIIVVVIIIIFIIRFFLFMGCSCATLCPRQKLAATRAFRYFGRAFVFPYGIFMELSRSLGLLLNSMPSHVLEEFSDAWQISHCLRQKQNCKIHVSCRTSLILLFGYFHFFSLSESQANLYHPTFSSAGAPFSGFWK